MSHKICKHNVRADECSQCFNERQIPVDAYFNAHRQFMSKLPPCDHDECGVVKCKRTSLHLEKAAKALVDCGYADRVGKLHTGEIAVIRNAPEVDHIYIEVDPINNEAQLFALAHWFLFPDKTLTLTGNGHFDVREQLQNFVRENLK